MKVIVTGVNGQLGYDVVKALETEHITPIGTDINNMDITDLTKVREVISSSNADAVIHCAAFTAVDAAEEKEELCRKVNAKGTENIAIVCKELGIKMLYISTDYVFDGTGEKFFTPEDKTNPLNMYGQTKYEGELAVRSNVEKFFIVRISWVFGINGNNFIKTMLRLGKEHKSVTVVNDQFGSPTYTFDLAKLLVQMIKTQCYGVYHATNEGVTSWYEFAKEIYLQAGLDVNVVPVSASEYKTKAKRPGNSRMSKEKLVNNGFSLLPDWKDALNRYLAELKNKEA